MGTGGTDLLDRSLGILLTVLGLGLLARLVTGEEAGALEADEGAPTPLPFTPITPDKRVGHSGVVMLRQFFSLLCR